MEKLPAEVLLVICGHLNQPSLFSIRLCHHTLAEVGAHYIFKHGILKFHSAPESYERLRGVADNPVFAEQIRKLIFEASRIEVLSTVEAFKHHLTKRPHAHYHANYHPTQRPNSPAKDSSERAHRLYRRNLRKWRNGDNDILTKSELTKMQEAYQEKFDAQEKVADGGKERSMLREVIGKLPKLEELALENSARCPHVLSKQFLERFPPGFFPPLDHDTMHSVKQVQFMLLPIYTKSLKLNSLRITAASPRLFSANSIRPLLSRCFSTLKELRLNLRLEDVDAEDVHFIGQKDLYKSIKSGKLLEHLIAAPLLEHLAISFDDYHVYEGPCASLDKVLGDHVWPQLKRLELTHVDGTAEQFFDTFKRQPRLKHISLGLIELTSGSWAKLLHDMRHQLTLNSTNLHDFVRSQNPDEFLVLDHLQVDPYVEDDMLITLSEAIELFVTERPEAHEDPTADPYDDPMNPATRLEDFVCEGELNELAAEARGSDFDSDLEGYLDLNDPMTDPDSNGSDDAPEDDEDEDEDEDDDGDALMPDLVE